MLPKEVVERIRRMEPYLTPAQIAAACNLPVDVVTAVIRGDIEAAEEDGDLALRIQVVEKPRFVRNRTVAAISPVGGRGKTTVLVSLALAAALYNPHRRPVAVVDFAETALAAFYLGFGVGKDEMLPTVLDFDANPLPDQVCVRHPAAGLLHVLPGVPAPAAHRFEAAALRRILDAFQRCFETVFVDLPGQGDLRDELLPAIDTLLVVIGADAGSFAALDRSMNSFQKAGITDRAVLVVNGVREGEKKRCQGHVRKIGLPAAAYVPDEPGCRRYPLEGEHPFFESGDFAAEVRHLLYQVFPDWSVKEREETGIRGLWRRLTSR